MDLSTGIEQKTMAPKIISPQLISFYRQSNLLHAAALKNESSLTGLNGPDIRVIGYLSSVRSGFEGAIAMFHTCLPGDIATKLYVEPRDQPVDTPPTPWNPTNITCRNEASTLRFLGYQTFRDSQPTSPLEYHHKGFLIGSELALKGLGVWEDVKRELDTLSLADLH